jgi:hypothetical protein
MTNTRAPTNSSERKVVEPRAEHEPRAQLAQVQDRVADLVAQQPWTMIGAAAGIGLACGAASRSAVARELTRTATATASGMAVRVALDALAQWFERERARG